MEGDIAHIVQTVLNVPVVTDEVEQPLRRSGLSREAGNAKNDFIGQFAGLLGLNEALQAKDLSRLRPGEIIIQLRTDRQIMIFQAIMPGAGGLAFLDR